MAQSVIRVKVIGAGSIGNHLARACRETGFMVTVVDKDQGALTRMREDIYPKRYGSWDDSIKLTTSDQEPKGGFDIVLIGTPPDTHLSIAAKILREEAPRLLQIEKPLCPPTLDGLKAFLEEVARHPNTAVVVGFNHLLAENTLTTERLIKEKNLGKLIFLETGVRSHWENIFKAHPWLSGPQDTYLGFWKRGGGAGGEHIHALNLWQHFAHVTGNGRVAEVQGMFEYVTDNNTSVEYDRLALLNLQSENGLFGRVIQDVITRPKKKWAELQFENGSLEWWNDVSKTTDEVHIILLGKEREVIKLEKNRTEEFLKETEHIRAILDGKIKIEDSPIRLERGIDSMFVLAAGHESCQKKKTIKVVYSI